MFNCANNYVFAFMLVAISNTFDCPIICFSATRSEIYFFIRELAKKGTACIVISSDLEELMSIQLEPETETMIGHSSQSSLTFQAFLLYVFAVMFLL